MSLDAIEASTDTVMTEDLIRLFKYAGCSPTACHACQKRIKAGAIFKLVPHKRTPNAPMTDEMCCADCGEESLTKRDRREEKAAKAFRYPRGWLPGGYSRPSKALSVTTANDSQTTIPHPQERP